MLAIAIPVSVPEAGFKVKEIALVAPEESRGITGSLSLNSVAELERTPTTDLPLGG